MVKKVSLHNLICFIFALIFLVSLITGCNSEGRKEVVLTTGFNKDEVFKIEDRVCTLPETNVYLETLKNKYVASYGEDILNVTIDGTAFADRIKDNVLADISKIKAMNILAEQKNVALSESEEAKAEEAADEYMSGLSQYETEKLMIDRDIIVKMYSEYALANKIYSEIIKDINPEISDDEARTITVLHIFFKTYTTNGKGEMVRYSEETQKEIYKKAQGVLELAKDPEHDFEELAYIYSDTDTLELSFGKGEMEPEIEQAAFDLGVNEVSDIVTTQYGYHIFKCINTFNREQTDLNKIRIAAAQREEVFTKDYDEFAGRLKVHFNDELWDSVSVTYDENIKTTDFFEIYNKYFTKE